MYFYSKDFVFFLYLIMFHFTWIVFEREFWTRWRSWTRALSLDFERERCLIVDDRADMPRVDNCQVFFKSTFFFI